MASNKGYDKFLKDLNPFSFGLPNTIILLSILFVMSVTIGIVAVTLINHNLINTNFSYILVNGAITGILAIMLPAVLTAIIVKAAKGYVDLKYIMFIAIIGTISYSIFILLASIVYILTNAYAISIAIILVGDASIFGWWFFADKVVLGQKKRAVFLALVQPTLNILLYIPASRFIISVNTPFNLLLIKLYAGIFIFLVVSYSIIYLVDRPYNKNFGFHSFDAVSQLMQNWLFDVNISTPFGQNFGTPVDILTDTIVFKDGKGQIKSIFFAPEIHYGPSGTLGGSDFPYLLEHYANQKYKTTTFVMHRTVNMDLNPISSSQLNLIKDALDKGVRDGKSSKNANFSYSKSKYGNSNIIKLGLNNVSLVTLTRAPKVTEDVDIETSLLLRELIEAKFGTALILDAHNSRYETAPKVELDGVKFDSAFAKEYVNAVKAFSTPDHKSRLIKMGVADKELYNRLGQPKDITKGNLNLAIFKFNGFKFAIIQINANNALPTFREAIIKHMKKKYGIEAELYTSDTHAVNSLEFNAGNVLGRHTKASTLIPILDEAVTAALLNTEPVTVQHARIELKKFKVWGSNTMENIITVAKSVYGITRILVPIIVVIGFIIAAWVILII